MNLGSCLNSDGSQLSGGSHTGELAMIWRVLGIFISAQSDTGALTSLSALVHRDLFGFFAIPMSSDKSEIQTIVQNFFGVGEYF